MPGHGKTLIRDEKTMEGYVDELIEVINQLELNRFHLVGYSMGGRTAMLLADRYPNRVKSLTLVGASPGLESEKSEPTKKERRRTGYIYRRKRNRAICRLLGKYPALPNAKVFTERHSKSDSKRTTHPNGARTCAIASNDGNRSHAVFMGPFRTTEPSDMFNYG